jgi:N-acetylmuramoyl-L-alanine amidase
MKLRNRHTASSRAFPYRCASRKVGFFRTLRKPILFVIVSINLLFAQQSDLSGLKICIDPGHGGNNPANDRLVVPDPGIQFWESESNFQKALLLRTMLQSLGATVLLTRETNNYPNDAAEPTLSQRVAFANANNVDWFHSIHSNASGLSNNTSINYTLMLVREKRPGGPSSSTGNGLGVPETQEAWDISGMMGPAINAYLRTQRHRRYLDWTFYGGANGGFSLGVLRGLLMPGQLSEGSFHDFFPETRRLMNNDYRKMEAYALRNSFLQYFGITQPPVGIIAGVQTNAQTGRPLNNTRVRLLPGDKVYTGDNYNNGFFMFDNLVPGTYKVRFETYGVAHQEVQVTVNAGAVTFVDRSFMVPQSAAIIFSSPTSRDTAFPVTATIGISFSRPMDAASVERAFSISPTIAGIFTWLNNFSTLIFKPLDRFQYATWYTYRIAGTAATLEGGELDGDGDGAPGGDFTVTFRTASQPVSVERIALIPTSFALHQNHPNPFNPNTILTFDLPEETHVRLTVYATTGKLVATLIDGLRLAGTYRLSFDAGSLPTGVYFCRLEAGSFVATRKMLLLK